MTYSISVGMYESSYDYNANTSNITFTIYLSSTNGQSYSNYPNMSVDYNIGGATGSVGVASAASCAGGATPAIASGTVTLGHNSNGYLGNVGGSFHLNGSGGYAPPSLDTSGSCGTTDFDYKPTAPTSVTPTVNVDKTISVAIAGVVSKAGTPTYYSAYSMNGGAYTGLQSSASSTIVFTGLTPGQNYNFSGYASNSDGTGNATYSSPSVFLPSGGKRYNGTAFVSTTTAKRYDGTTWQTITTAKRYDGTSWVNLS